MPNKNEPHKATCNPLELNIGCITLIANDIASAIRTTPHAVEYFSSPLASGRYGFWFYMVINIYDECVYEFVY